MKLRRYLAVLAVLIIWAAVLCGWGMLGDTPARAAELRVGLVTDVGKVNDKTFNQSAYEGMVRAAKEFGMETNYIETVQPTDFEKNIAIFAEEGYDMVITVGFMLGDATKKMAARYPKVKFAIVDFAYDPPLPNVLGLVFREDQAGFLVGALAGLMTKSDKVGGVYGMAIPPVVRFRKGYEAGVLSTNPGASSSGVYMDSFTAPDRGKAAAEAQVSEGVDVLFGAGGITCSGAIRAGAEKDIWVIGVDKDEYYTTFGGKKAPRLLTCALKRVDNAVYAAVKSLAQGRFQGGVYEGTVANGGVGYAPFHDAAQSVPEAVKKRLDEIARGLTDGSVTTGVSE